MTNKNDSRCNYNKPKSQEKTQKTKTKRNTVTWESKSSIKLIYVQSHIPSHLQISVHSSPIFLQEQRPEHPLSALHPDFEFLTCLRNTWLRHTACHKTISLLVHCPFIWTWKVLHWYQWLGPNKCCLIHSSENILLQWILCIM